ncbi:MAG: aminotransferase class I/II-fold pyridoxal phosphate-dependent enzyme [Deltaproteobacteria bacterium]|nr:MAG: aminotransferase class I/II-fold pyridoxal phosphate-dependent enzyme [Deltaproteobacteria bacterium]
MKELSKVVEGFKESIFATLSKKARKNEAINLGQGFPDFDGPAWIIDLAKKALDKGEQHVNQYAPFEGVMPLREAISKNYQKYYNLDYDPQTEITVVNGATEAIFSTILAIVNPGDEVIIFEPFYDSYLASIKLAGGIPVPVTLKTREFNWDLNELKEAFSSKTKLVILNSPHNPTGKIFSTNEVEELGTLLKKHDAYLMSDEVYEFLVFGENKHIPPATHAGLKERTITISSIGKTFGLTGWKIGWTCAPKHLTHAIRMVHQFNTFSVNQPIQHAVAEALEKMDDYLPEFRALYQKKRDYFLEGMKKCGYDPIEPQGTYFVMVPIETHTTLEDVGYCMELIETRKVASIPPSAFYIKGDEGKKYLRFCFAKKDETLQSALENLSR